MLTARCPNCNAPLTFRHAASLSAVCGSCESVVVRTDVDLVTFGKVSVFNRELSPLQVGVTGKVEGRAFSIVGGVRKERERIRWNEWYVIFEDGATGWLGEGNGQLHLFQGFAPEDAPTTVLLPVGQSVSIGGVKWTVAESATFRVTQAVGELPFTPDPALDVPYSDLRDHDLGRLGTLDDNSGVSILWVGDRVRIEDLKAEGLRPIAGWSDPDIVAFDGPELEGTQAASCPCCGAALDLRNPGATVRVVCAYCESELGVEELESSSTLVEIARKEQEAWRPTIPVGTSGELDGIRWDVIGAMERGIIWEGMTFSWSEYLLYNPYRGTRWLVEDETGHWNLVDLVDEFPDHRHRTRVAWDGRTYRRFQGGSPRVFRVVGEFTWEVRKGDVSESEDFVSPPFTLSRERQDRELNWSLAEYIDADEVSEAFGLGEIPAPRGVFPNQPNPWKSRGQYAKVGVSLLLMLGFMTSMYLGVQLFSAQQTLLDMRVPAADTVERVVFVSEPFYMPAALRNRAVVRVDSPWGRYDASPGAALLNVESGAGSEPRLSAGLGSTFEGRTSPLEPGNYVLRLAVRNNGGTAQDNPGGKEWRVRVIRDVPYTWPLVFMLLFSILPIVVLLAKISSFEQRRWINAD